MPAKRSFCVFAASFLSVEPLQIVASWSSLREGLIWREQMPLPAWLCLRRWQASPPSKEGPGCTGRVSCLFQGRETFRWLRCQHRFHLSSCSRSFVLSFLRKSPGLSACLAQISMTYDYRLPMNPFAMFFFWYFAVMCASELSLLMATSWFE